MDNNIPFYPPKKFTTKVASKIPTSEENISVLQTQKQSNSENCLWSTLQIIGILLVLLFFLWFLFGGLFEKNNEDKYKSKGIKYLDDQEIYQMQSEQIQEDSPYKFGTPY